ncbi:uncharacterized protein LOC129608281 [Condylostylus longicornis]|uniref:uncharacterized protein LOC129608281 n=1 Tax=Condylostylus longicornis TaxID=2530218 RepID=UPI00244DDFAB|nr:uncharacterized protein LOC129608281 [Condylostylus longicornis]
MVDNFFSMWKVRELADKVTNVVMNYTEIEGKVREATNDDPWGPTGVLMQEIAHATFTYEHFPEVMSMLWKRMLQDNKTNWRRTYKSLLLLNYLVRNGSERVVTSSREHIYDLRTLENYTFTDENGKDQGINVRHKVSDLIQFIQDDDRLREERRKAKRNKDKYIGMSSDVLSGGSRYAAGSGYNDSNWNSNSSYKSDNRNTYSDSHPSYRYEDEGYEDEREKDDSDNDASSPRRYRDRSSPTEIKQTSFEQQKTQNANISITNLKSSTGTNKFGNNTIKTSVVTKKIDLGAAANYGKEKDSFGIHSPTHRDSPDENLFETCPPPKTNNSSIIRTDDLKEIDDFNPRADDNQEFGDFESAFNATGSSAKSIQLDVVASTVPSNLNVVTDKNDDFADFKSAFDSSNHSLTDVAIPTNQSNNLLITTSNMENISKEANNIDLFESFATHPPSLPGNQSSNSNLLDEFGALAINSGFSNVERPTARNIKCFMNFAQLVKKIQKVETEKDLNYLETLLKGFLNVLPGEITFQQLTRMDISSYESDWNEFASTEYKNVLHSLMNLTHDLLLINDKTFNMNLIYNIFSINFNEDYIISSLEVLLENLNIKPTLAVDILECLIKNGEIITMGILHATKDLTNIQGFDKNKAEQKSEQFLTLILNIHSRVANRIGLETPNIFCSNFYGYNILVAILNALGIAFKCNECQLEPVFDEKRIAVVLSKIVVHFNNDVTYQFNIFLRILAHLSTIENQYKIFINNIFTDLSNVAINIVGYKILDQNINLSLLLGSNAISISSHWEYFLLSKFPFSMYNVSESSIINLTTYFQTNCPEKLFELFKRSLNVWSTKTSTLNNNIKQHIFLSKLLIYSLKCLIDLRLEESFIFEIKNKLFNGTKNHLESSDIVFRYVGMITAEICINMLNNINEPKLNFDYKNLNSELTEIIDSIKKFAIVSTDNYSEIKTVEEFSILVKSFFDNNDFTVRQFSRYSKKEEKIFSKKEVSPKECSKNSKIIENLYDAGLDSDDDLEPYDMSNDKSVHENKKPKFLLDLKEIILQADDPDVFQACLQCAENLIKQQLPNNDVKLAIELLRIFLCLERKFYFDEFENTKLNICVQICTIYPGECGEFLCEQFHLDDNNYSLPVRILILNIISKSVKRLSSIEKETTASPKIFCSNSNQSLPYPRKFETKMVDKANNSKKIIYERLRKKTRRLLSKPSKQIEIQNTFSKHVGSFFFPLVRGARKTQILHLKNEKAGYAIDMTLIVTYFSTLTNIILAAENCPTLNKICREVFEITSFLRFSQEAKVRIAVLEMIGALLITVPRHVLIDEFLNECMELKSWLGSCLRSPVIGGDTNEECREVAASLFSICIDIIGNSI